jgi:hypothetical protein
METRSTRARDSRARGGGHEEEEPTTSSSHLQLPFHYHKAHPGPPRDEHGRVKVAKGPADVLMEEMLARPGDYQRGSVLGGRPWWHTLQQQDGGQHYGGLLPSMAKVVKAGVFDPDLTIHHNAMALLSSLASILHPSALHKVDVGSGRCPFFEPLVKWERVRDPLSNQHVAMVSGQCMHVCPKRVKEEKAWVRLKPCHNGHYVYVKLGLGKDRQVVEEHAHRLLMWAILGPLGIGAGADGGLDGHSPPSVVVMHSCHHRLCLSPLHLVGGTRHENLLGSALEAFDRQLRLADEVLATT